MADELQTCTDCANPLWCRTTRKCQGVRIDPNAGAEYREAAMRDYVRRLNAAGIVEMHEAAPSGQLAFTGTLAQWLAFLDELENTYFGDDNA